MSFFEKIALITLIIVVFAASVGVFLGVYFHSPFHFPYKTIRFNVSGKRNVVFLDLIDADLIENGLKEYSDHMDRVEEWKKDCEAKIQKSLFRKHRQKQYQKSLDEKNVFRFQTVRERTRYRQVNYERTSYSVLQEGDSFSADYALILERYRMLEAIGFETTVSAYNSSSQRKLMTKDLREKIAARDNYTCRICGKYMPDGVGLQIDHIVPIKKGGKSVESNLQVLCSKCNASKGSKLYDGEPVYFKSFSDIP